MMKQLQEYITEWRTSKEIQDAFGINARTMRLVKVDYNDKYDPIERPLYILSGNQGYKITHDQTLIRDNNKDVNFKQAITMLKQYWQIEKSFSDIDNLKLDLFKELSED